MAILTAESYFVTNLLLTYVRSEDYFTPGWQTLAVIGVALLLVLCTYTLTVGAWGKWEQYFVVPAPISGGIFLGLLMLNPTYAILVAAVCYAIIAYDVWVSTNVSKMMLFFDPRTILRFSNRGVMFAFALLAGVMTFLHPSIQKNQFDVSGEIAEIAQQQVDTALESQQDKVESTVESQVGQTGFSFEISNFNLDLRSTVKSEVDKIIAPYREFIPPLIAFLVYFLIRFLGGLANFVFNLIAPLLFGLARGTGLFHILHVPVQKETLSFSPEQDVDHMVTHAPSITPK